MKVELLSHTPDALNLLLRTKNTRLAFDDDPAGWTDEQKAEHLEYMLGTIKSSWEFVDYTFRITGVSRAFTHQLVRTRTGSYAQESQRTVKAKPDYLIPESMHERPHLGEEYCDAAAAAFQTYEWLIEEGAQIQDARGILPTATLTNIVAKIDLRSLHETAKVRLCTRTQGEYQQVFRSMRERVLEVHPWADPMLQVHCVSTGTCAFPRYGRKECPFWDFRMHNDQLKREVKAMFWGSEIQAANPVAKAGKAS
jgi:flavin-dependent thymidylate synthase